MDTTPPVFHQVRMAQLAAAAHAVYEKEHPFEGSKRGAAYTAWKDSARRSVLQTIQPQQQAAREDPGWILTTDFHMPEGNASKAALMRMMPSTAYCLEDFDYPPNLLRPGVKRPRSQRPGRCYDARAEALKAWKHQQELNAIRTQQQELKAREKQEEVQQAALRRLQRQQVVIQQTAWRRQQEALRRQQEALHRQQEVQHQVRQLLEGALGDMHLAELRRIIRVRKSITQPNHWWWEELELSQLSTRSDQEASEHEAMAVEEWRTKQCLNEEWERWYEAELSGSSALREALTDWHHWPIASTVLDTPTRHLGTYRYILHHLQERWSEDHPGLTSILSPMQRIEDALAKWEALHPGSITLATLGPDSVL